MVTKGLTFVVILMYLIGTPVLLHLYPKSAEDYDSYIKFVIGRFRIYEIMCLVLAVVIFLDSANRWIKSMIGFLIILVVSSLIDKLVFKVTSYLYSDILIGIIALGTSILIYRKYDYVRRAKSPLH